MTLDEYMAARSASNASTAGGSSGAFTTTQKLNDTTTRSSSAASYYAPSAAAAAAAAAGGNDTGSSRPSIVTNAWSRMTSLGDSTDLLATTLPSTQSVESFPETPGREMPSSYAPSEEFAPAAYTGLVSDAVVAPVAVRVPVTSAAAAMAPSTGPGTAETTPRTLVTSSAGATPTVGSRVNSHEENQERIFNEYSRIKASAEAAAAKAGISSSFKEIIPGMIDHSKLTKAQRKNLKRAEKKAAARLDETASLVSCATTGATTEGDDHLDLHAHHQFAVHEKDENALHQHALGMDTNNYLGETPLLQPTSPVNGSSSSGGNTARSNDSMSQESLECLVQHKLNKSIAVLVNFGFNHEASARTAIACGGNVHAAVQDLLVAQSGAESVYPPGTKTPVDISEELTTVQLLKQRYRSVFSPAAVDAVIVQCFGNLEEVGIRLQIQAQNLKMQQQQQQQAEKQAQGDQQGFFYGARTTNKLPDTTPLVPASDDAGSGTANGGAGGDGSGSLFGGNFGLPDEITWGQSASQHPAACSSNEWDSLLGGGGGNEGGSLFGTDATGAGRSGLGFDTTKEQNLSTQQHSLFDTSPGFGLGLSSASLPSYQPPPPPPQQYQQSAPQLMPEISQQQYQKQQQVLGYSKFSSNTVLSGGGGGGGGGSGGGGFWGSANTNGGSFGAASGGGYYGGIPDGGIGSAAVGATRLSYEANNSESGYVNQEAFSTPLHIPTHGPAAEYGMIKNSDVGQGMGQYQQAYSHQQQQQQQMHYSGGAAGNTAEGRLWEQQQEGHVRSSFDSNQPYSNTEYYANSPQNIITGASIDGVNGFNGNGAAGYPKSMMIAMAQEQQQQQAGQDQREIQSLMGNLGLYSS